MTTVQNYLGPLNALRIDRGVRYSRIAAQQFIILSGEVANEFFFFFFATHFQLDEKRHFDWGSAGL